MKNAYFWFLGLVFVSVCFSCSKDDEPRFVIPEVPGENLKQDHVQLVFLPTEENSSLTFSFKLKDHKEDVLINWGDDEKLYVYRNGEEVTHEYTMDQEQYLVSIQAPKLTMLDLNYEGGDQLRSVFLGACPELEMLNLITYNNKLKDLDLSQCSQLSGDVRMNVYEREFNFAGLRNFESVSLNVYCNNVSVLLEDYTCKSLDLYIQASQADNILIRNCPKLEKLEISGYTYNYNCHSLPVNKLELDVKNIEKLDISQLLLSHKLDVSHLTSLKTYVSWYMDCQETIVLPNSLNTFYLRNSALSGSGFSNIKYLDFRNCSDLRSLCIEYVEGIEALYYDGLENIEYMTIWGAGSLEEVTYIKEKEENSADVASDIKEPVASKAPRNYLFKAVR